MIRVRVQWVLIWIVGFTILFSVILRSQTAVAWNVHEGVQCGSVYGEMYVGSDGKPYYAEDTEKYLIYETDGTVRREQADAGYARQWFYMIGDDGAMRKVFCVEAGVDFMETDAGYTAESGLDSQYFEKLPESAQEGIALTLLFGWQSGRKLPVSGINEDDYAVATQILLWEYQQQLRTGTGSRRSNGWTPADQYYRNIEDRPAEKAYNWILEQIENHTTIPGFAAETAAEAAVYTLKYNADSQIYSITLTDTHNTLADLIWDTPTGIQVSRKGNQYTFSTSHSLSSAITVKASKQTSSLETQLFIWGHPGKQTMVSGAEDVQYFYMKFDTEEFGDLHLIKTSEDGQVSGISFTIQGVGYKKDAVTGDDGTVDVQDLPPGEYTVTETGNSRYEPQSVQTVTIQSGRTTEVKFRNTLKRGSLRVVKTAEDEAVEGVTFHLKGTSMYGTKVDLKAVTNEQGVAIFSDVPVSGQMGYELEELEVDVRYVTPEVQQIHIQWKETTEASVYNALKKFQVTVSKSDRETVYAQGDGSLEGAVYGLYHGDELMDTYYTDAKGEFTTSWYPCGSGWYIKELVPSEGYLLDPEIHEVGAEPEIYSLEWNSIVKGASEQVLKGRIQLIKHTDQVDGTVSTTESGAGEGIIEEPEEGAVFEIYRKSSGSYEAAAESERDRLVTDVNGYARTRELPYGLYTVHQTDGAEGKALIPDFTVYIAENEQIYSYILKNPTAAAKIRIEKRDAETGELIASAGTGFRILDKDGEPIRQEILYPTPLTLDTFYTNDEGWLMLPEELPYGQYYLEEVQAAYGYVRNPEWVVFSVDGSQAMVTVTKSNSPQKGRICIEKSGESFVSTVESEGVYQPLYAMRYLEGAVYQITAAEDIYTADGVLRAAAGDLMDTITTDAEGLAMTKELYLGRYEVREIQAPAGMVLDEEVLQVELFYAGGDVTLVERQLNLQNERQQAVVALNKTMESQESYGIGSRDEVCSVRFGLYAAEELQAEDGTCIPAGGCIEIAGCDEEGMIAFQSDLPFGSYYVKEISTHEAYLMDGEIYPVDFVYSKNQPAVVWIGVNGGEPIENRYKRGCIEGTKVNSAGKTLAGAIIGLFPENAESFEKTAALAITESGDKGEFCFDNVPYGSYILKELAAPEGYILSDWQEPVSLEEDGQIVRVRMENERITGKLLLTKTDVSTGDPVPGCAIEIRDSAGQVRLQDVTDENGVVTFELEYGDYFYQEYDAPEGYLIDETAYPFSILENGQIVKAEMTNQRITGTLQIWKQDAGDQHALSGCGIEVLDAVGHVLYRKSTDDQGRVAFSLPYGEYYYREYEAPQGYVLDETAHAFSIEEMDQMVEQILQNQKQRKTPKTGDSSSDIYPWMFGCIISLAVVLALIKIYRRRS